jgi:hypothetical protein
VGSLMSICFHAKDFWELEKLEKAWLKKVVK